MLQDKVNFARPATKLELEKTNNTVSIATKHTSKKRQTKQIQPQIIILETLTIQIVDQQTHQKLTFPKTESDF